MVKNTMYICSPATKPLRRLHQIHIRDGFLDNPARRVFLQVDTVIFIDDVGVAVEILVPEADVQVAEIVELCYHRCAVLVHVLEKGLAFDFILRRGLLALGQKPRNNAFGALKTLSLYIMDPASAFNILMKSIVSVARHYKFEELAFFRLQLNGKKLLRQGSEPINNF